MTIEHHTWVELPQFVTCDCGQELDTCTRQHCPRCGSTLAPRAA